MFLLLLLVGCKPDHGGGDGIDGKRQSYFNIRIKPYIQEYCGPDCHVIDLEKREIFINGRTLLKLKYGLMPPPDSEQASKMHPKDIERLIKYLEKYVGDPK